jgi:UDP-glucose 4-epimerase
MRILVTGGAGYIGSHTVRMLENVAEQVVVYDNLSKGHRQAVQSSAFVQGDLFDSPLLAQTIRSQRIDAVVHFAAFSLVGESMEKPNLYYRNNVQGTLNLLDVMLENGVDKLVFSSTAAVYGEPACVPITEDTAKDPTNVYGRTKLIMEQAMADYAAACGLKFTALRYFNACGAHPAGDIGEDHCPESHLIPLILQTCLGKRDSIKIFGDDYPTKDGTCIRDYIHVDDLAQAHVLALQALYRGSASPVYNLGNGCGFTVKEVITAAEAVTGRSIRKEIVARRAGDPAVLIASAEKIRRELGWKPEYRDIQSIIQTAWQWHQTHPEGFSS